MQDRRLAAGFTRAPRASWGRLMNTSSHEFVTVDMRGLKAGLVERARLERVSVSVLVRRAVSRDLGLIDQDHASASDAPGSAAGRAAMVKLSLRMTPDEAAQLAAGARAAGLSRGAYLAGLLAQVPVLLKGGSRAEHLSALRASCDELSVLSRNIHRLAALLRQADGQQARHYREVLDQVDGDMRNHLVVAARVLANVQPRTHGVGATAASCNSEGRSA